MIIKGKVHKFGNDINTDDIIAAKYWDAQDEAFLGSKCMENIRPDFAQSVSAGDIIVGGKNFGCGSSREHAPLSIKGAGISLVIAKSFARIFYRNCINIGLPILECAQADAIKEGDIIEVDLDKGIIKNKTKKQTYQAQSFPPFLQNIIKAGGIIGWVKRQKKA